MIRYFVILLSFLYSLTLLQAYVPHANYWMNRDYISSVLCENKDNPELDCEGKCHLVKEINKETSSPEAEVETNVLLMVEFPSENIELPKFQIQNEGKSKFTTIQAHLRLGFIRSIFHPPKFCFELRQAL